MLDFVLGIAQSVLSDLIKDMIKGKTQAADRGTIEKDVAHRLLILAREQHLQDLEEMRRQILAEIDVISARDPDLHVSHEGIRLTSPPRRPFLPWNSESQANSEMMARLHALGEIVARRRAELIPPSTPIPEEVSLSSAEAELSSVPAQDGAFKGWLPPSEDPPQADRWSTELKQLQDRIAQRRTHRRLNHDQ